MQIYLYHIYFHYQICCQFENLYVILRERIQLSLSCTYHEQLSFAALGLPYMPTDITWLFTRTGTRRDWLGTENSNLRSLEMSTSIRPQTSTPQLWYVNNLCMPVCACIHADVCKIENIQFKNYMYLYYCQNFKNMIIGLIHIQNISNEV